MKIEYSPTTNHSDLIKRGARLQWPSSLYYPVRNSGQMIIVKTHPTLVMPQIYLDIYPLKPKQLENWVNWVNGGTKLASFAEYRNSKKQWFWPKTVF